MDNDTHLRLIRFSRRVRLARAWRGAAVGLCAGALVAAALAGLDAWRVVFAEPLTLAGAVAAGGVLGAIVGALWRVRTIDVADSIDRRAGLENRVRTAIAVPDGAFSDALREDARLQLQDVRPKQVFPLRLGRWHAGALALSAVAASLFLLGNTSLFLSEEQKADREVLKKAAPLVERVARPNLEDRTADEKALNAEMKRFAKLLERARIDRPEALQKANDLAQKADELARQRFKQAEQSLQTADQALAKMMQDELAKAGLENVDPADLMKDPAAAESQMSKLDQQIRDLEKRLGDKGLSDAQRAELSQQKADAEKQRLELKLSKEARETFDKLFNSKEFKEIMEMARKLRQEAQAGQQGQQKLTAEQVKELQDRLEELAKQLKDPEKLKEYLDALREALNHAGEG
ncbi:MAG: hypothetical protein H6534_03595 [Chthonomonadaceae bacterium]|nr:hypothetical protein [Chthonomonadaceae bacterium]